MKKVVQIISIICACCVLFVCVAFAASSASIKKTSSTTVTSNPVGLATSANYSASANSSSSGNMTANCQAAWSGWPFSTEGKLELKPGQSATYKDTQTKLSSFRIQLTGAGTGSGSVSC